VVSHTMCKCSMHSRHLVDTGARHPLQLPQAQEHKERNKFLAANEGRDTATAVCKHRGCAEDERTLAAD
jgi:hypothetical protein